MKKHFPRQRGFVDFNFLVRFIGAGVVALIALGASIVWASIEIPAPWAACAARMVGTVLICSAMWIACWLRGVL